MDLQHLMQEKGKCLPKLCLRAQSSEQVGDGSTRRAGSSLQCILKKRKTCAVLILFAPWQINTSQRSVQDLRTKPRPLLCRALSTVRFYLMKGQDGIILMLSHWCALVAGSASSMSCWCFCFKAELPSLFELYLQPDEVKKEHVSLCLEAEQ